MQDKGFDIGHRNIRPTGALAASRLEEAAVRGFQLEHTPM